MDHSQITVEIAGIENNEEDLVSLKEGGNYEESNEFEKETSKVCPEFPVNFVCKQAQKSPLCSQKQSEENLSKPIKCKFY